MRNRDDLSCWLRKNAQCWGCALSFILGKMRTIAWERAFRITLRNCPKEVEESSYIHDCGEGGSKCNQAHMFCRKLLLVPGGLLLVRGAYFTMKDLSAFLDMKWCKSPAHKISWKYPTIWWPILEVFPGHRVPRSWSSPWTSFRGYFEGLWSQQLVN